MIQWINYKGLYATAAAAQSAARDKLKCLGEKGYAP